MNLTINVKGTLLSPTGSLTSTAVIGFESIASAGGIAIGTSGVHTTDSVGAYDFTLSHGVYIVAILFDDTWLEQGKVLVNESTPDVIDLGALLRYSYAPDIPTVVEGAPDWIKLHQDARGAHDTVGKVLTAQVGTSTVAINNEKEIHTNTRLAVELAEDSLDVTIGSGRLLQQPVVFEDSHKNTSSTNAETLTTGNGTSTQTHEVYDSSSGKVTLKSGVTATGPQGGYEDTTVVDAENEHTTGTYKLSYSDSDLTDTREITDTAVKHKTTATAHEGPYTATAGTSLVNETTYIDKFGATVVAPKAHQSLELGIEGDIHKGEIVTEQLLLVDDSDELHATQVSKIKVYNKETSITQVTDGFTSEQTTIVDNFKITRTEAELPVLEVDTDRRRVSIKGTLVIDNPADFKGDAGHTIFEVMRHSPTEGNSPDGPSWHTTYTIGDKYRVVNQSVDGYVNPNTWSSPINLSADDGAPGDTLYIEYEYADQSQQRWHEVLQENDVWRHERTIENGFPTSGWSEAVRIVGFEGVTGVIFEAVYQYAVKATAPESLWHANFSTGDHFRRDRILGYLTEEDRENDNPTAGNIPWGNITQVVPINGVDYGFKQTTVYLYQRKQSVPQPPSGYVTYSFAKAEVTNPVVLNGWSLEIPGGTGDLYIAAAIVTSLAEVDTIEPSEWNISLWSRSGYNSANLTLFKRGNTPPTLPRYDLTFNFATKQLTGSLDGWETETPTGTDAIYLAIAQAYSIEPTDVILPNEWRLSQQGVAGLNQANLILYTRADVRPPLPTGDVTYRFLTGEYTGSMGVWDPILPEGTGDVYQCVASAISYDPVDTVVPAEWDILKFSEAGSQVASITLFKASDAVPDVYPKQGTYYYETGALSFVSREGWYDSPPTNTTGKLWVTTVRLTSAVGTKVETITQARWSGATLFIENGYRTATIDIFHTTTAEGTAPAANTGTLTHNFETNVTTGMNKGWTDLMPTSLGIIWFQRSVASAYSGNATSQVLASKLSTPEVFVKDGKVFIQVNLYALNTVHKFTGDMSWNSYTNTAIFVTDPSTPWSTVLPDNVDSDGTLYIMSAARQVLVDQVSHVFSASEFSTPQILTRNPPSPVAQATPYLYILSTDEPATPSKDLTYTFSNGVLSGAKDGWNQKVPTTDDARRIWATVATARSTTPTANVPAHTWARPIRTQGLPGLSVNTVMLYATSYLGGAAPALPDSNLVYNFVTNVVTGKLAGWSQVPPNTLGVLWGIAATALATAEFPTDIISPSEWSSARAHSRNGAVGSNGKHGQGSFVVTLTYEINIPASTSGKDSDILSIAQRPAQNGDIITYRSASGTAVSSSFVRTFFRQKGVYTEAEFMVHGNAIINGTLAAEKLVAASITGDKIKAHTTILVGSNAGINGDDSSGSPYKNYRFWSGSATPSSANFSVDRSGTMAVRNATIQGRISASTMEGGVITGTNIKGSVIEGSIVIGGSQIVVPTVADSGSGTRYLGYAGLQSQASVSAGANAVPTCELTLPNGTLIASPAYTMEGTATKEGTTYYKNYNRWINSSVNINNFLVDAYFGRSYYLKYARLLVDFERKLSNNTWQRVSRDVVQSADFSQSYDVARTVVVGGRSYYVRVWQIKGGYTCDPCGDSSTCCGYDYSDPYVEFRLASGQFSVNGNYRGFRIKAHLQYYGDHWTGSGFTYINMKLVGS